MAAATTLVRHMVTFNMMATPRTSNSARKITVEVPADLLDRAQAASGESLTETVRHGLRLVAAGQAFRNLRSLRGKVRFSRSAASLREDRG
jgi:hypothetical protein